MKTDAYTKTVLTIIAVCLIILAAKSFDSGFLVSTAHAQLNGNGTTVDVNIARIGGFDFKTSGVHNNASLPVNIERVRDVELGAPVLPVKSKEN
jgi:hypothetical protein